MRRITILPLSLLLSLMALGQTPTQDQPLKTRTDLVNVAVLAKKRESGRILSGLGKDDFTVYEDGVKQTISHFSRERLPLLVILLIDRAGCITDAFTDQIREATIKALNQLNPEDEVAVMTFSSTVRLVQPFTRNRQEIADHLKSVEQQRHGPHSFNGGMFEAANYMSKAANPTRRRAIIVLTGRVSLPDSSIVSEKEALETVLESGVVVSGALLGRSHHGPTRFGKIAGPQIGDLKLFVNETGGELVSDTQLKMDETLVQLVDHLAVSYSLAYMPTNTARDGKRRRLKIELSPEIEKREGKTVLIARRSYIMAKDVN